MAAKVLAIDVGYSFVKWSRRRDNTIVKGIFPSIVVPKPPGVRIVVASLN